MSLVEEMERSLAQRKPAKPSLGAALLGLAIVLLGAAAAVLVLGVALGVIGKVAVWVMAL